jgi:hypothetical protein
MTRWPAVTQAGLNGAMREQVEPTFIMPSMTFA